MHTHFLKFIYLYGTVNSTASVSAFATSVAMLYQYLVPTVTQYTLADHYWLLSNLALMNCANAPSPCRRCIIDLTKPEHLRALPIHSVTELACTIIEYKDDAIQIRDNKICCDGSMRVIEQFATSPDHILSSNFNEATKLLRRWLLAQTEEGRRSAFPTVIQYLSTQVLDEECKAQVLEAFSQPST